jgi:DNA-directed RNA polymerase subunit delta
MKRVIKDYKNLSPEHEELINTHFPNGFENENLVSFTTPKGEFIKALEIRTDDTIYLFKIDKNMKVDDEENQDNESMVMSEFENFKDDDADDDDDNSNEDHDEITGEGSDEGGGSDDDED